MIECATKGQALYELIKWLEALEPYGWFCLFLSISFSIIATYCAYRFIVSVVNSNIGKKLDTYFTVSPPNSYFVVPFIGCSCMIGITMCLFGLVEITSPLIISYGFIVLTTLLIIPFKRFSSCFIIISEGKYYISSSWIGKDFIKIDKKCLRLKDSRNSIIIYYNNKIQGVIVDPGSRPWLKNRKRLFDNFIKYVLS